MSSVFLSGPTNSTMFTTCCEVAINDEQGACPRCKQDVQPKGRDARWSTAYGPIKRGQRWYGNWFPNHRTERAAK